MIRLRLLVGRLEGACVIRTLQVSSRNEMTTEAPRRIRASHFVRAQVLAENACSSRSDQTPEPPLGLPIDREPQRN